MHGILKQTHHILGALCLMALTVTLSTTVAHGEAFTWEDIKVPFKETFRFSVTETAVVRASIPSDVLSTSDRVSIFLDIDKNNPRIRPYMMVNNNREAFYYLGGNRIVNIRSDHLKAGVNELFFGDQTTSGDLIFIYEMRIIEFKN